MILGERVLWCKVIELALEDALRGDAEALRWFNRGGPDFQDVCYLAGMEPVPVREAALSMLPAEDTRDEVATLAAVLEAIAYELAGAGGRKAA